MAASAPVAVAAEWLDSLHVIRRVGAGSNGAVLLCERSGEVQARVALKVASHFWSEEAKAILSCERHILNTLPAHPNIIRVLAEFEAPIPDKVLEHLPSEMATTVRCNPGAPSVAEHG